MPERWRLPVTIGIYLLLLVGLGLPNLGIAGHGLGRSLIPAGMLFSQLQIGAVGPGVDPGLLGPGINVGYLGIGLHQLGLLLSLPSVWVLATEDINRWIYRIAVVGGCLLTASAPVVAVAWFLIRGAGAAGLLGWGWLPALIAGLAILLVARRSRDRIDRSWYVTRPELQ